jgi:hypothetical protein
MTALQQRSDEAEAATQGAKLKMALRVPRQGQ